MIVLKLYPEAAKMVSIKLLLSQGVLQGVGHPTRAD